MKNINQDGALSFDTVSAFVEGVSEKDFHKLLDDLQTEINDCRTYLRNYDDLLSDVQEKNLVDNVSEWQDNFKKQVSDTDALLDNTYQKIEEVFNEIFTDWEDYQNKNELLKEESDTNE